MREFKLTKIREQNAKLKSINRWYGIEKQKDTTHPNEQFIITKIQLEILNVIDYGLDLQEHLLDQ